MLNKSDPLTPKEIEQINNWNVPDWRKEELYSFADTDLSPEQWRWEFVRRDEVYRKAWNSQSGYAFSDFGLLDWVNPKEKAAPEFRRACHLVDFDQVEDWEQRLHYMALADAKRAGGLIFSVDVFSPIEPQLATIKATHQKLSEKMLAPEDRPGKVARKNNSTETTRKRSYLLRLLDASNAGIAASDILNVLAVEESFKIISETGMRKNIAFAREFWMRL